MRHLALHAVTFGLAAAILSPAAEYRGGLVSPPLPKPNFTLTDTSGVPFDFRAKTEGYVTLLFFGYTHCPDMCPMQMATMAKALKTLPPEQASKFKVVFVTTDAERDTRQRLRTWLDHFGRNFIGLTGSPDEVEAAQLASNVDPAKRAGVLRDGSYAVGHALWVLAYTTDNLAHVIYPVGVKQDDWAHDLALLAEESWKGDRQKPAGNVGSK
jgi:protein SCO1/2